MSLPIRQTESLRSQKDSADAPNSQQGASLSPEADIQPIGERRFATDLFMVFAYSLLAIALACQLTLIIWLDII